MEPVRIVNAAVVHPQHQVAQDDAVEYIARLGGDRRRLGALARGAGIASRYVSLPPEALATLDRIEARNARYREIAPSLSVRSAAMAMGECDPADIGCVATSSCTGYMLPGWSVDIVDGLGLQPGTARTPVTEAGCAGGVVALSRAVDHLRFRQGAAALVVATELCSLALQRSHDEGNLAASLLFGDGSGACLLASGAGPGLTIIDAASTLLPGTRHLLGFDLTDHGFFPVLRRELVEQLVPAAVTAAEALLQRHGLRPEDVAAWLLHPGGARILAGIERRAGLVRSQTRWSWDSLEHCGNMSSVAVIDVIRRYLDDDAAPGGYGIVAAFGPGVSIELLLVRRD